ncbi:MAG: methionine biosynthesis protein MetW [Thiohalospira sp.]
MTSPIDRRPALAIISRWIRDGARVLDLGCGDGTLLGHLRASKGAGGYGIEIDDANVIACIRQGLSVIQSDLDAGLNDFDAESFDYVILSQTLQAVRYPDRLLEEMMRVGQEGIVTFPNMGYWRYRLRLALTGRMPVSSAAAAPGEWYNTPNIHLCTLADFEALCEDMGIEILEMTAVNSAHRSNPFMRAWPNVLGEIALYRFRRR